MFAHIAIENTKSLSIQIANIFPLQDEAVVCVNFIHCRLRNEWDKITVRNRQPYRW